MRTRAEKAWRDNINKKPKEQLLNKAFFYFMTGSDLKYNNFNKKMTTTRAFHTYADICRMTCDK
jgi:hypothetical protein